MSTILQAVGATVITIGVAIVFVPAGLIVGGTFLVLFGLALERTNAK
jgi:hypothetical protein